jgi:methylmalonyl-CoA/ethylmalonyl-CoA epimerase
MALALKFHHIGVAVQNLDKAIPTYRDLFGHRVVSGPFDDPVQKVSVCFLASDADPDVQVELVAPLAEDSPIKTILSKGGGGYHFCYQTPDIEAAISEAKSQGCVIVSQPVPAVAFKMRRIAWFYTPTRQLIELVERN